jgi:hypothetical protein
VIEKLDGVSFSCDLEERGARTKHTNTDGARCWLACEDTKIGADFVLNSCSYI